MGSKGKPRTGKPRPSRRRSGKGGGGRGRGDGGSMTVSAKAIRSNAAQGRSVTFGNKRKFTIYDAFMYHFCSHPSFLITIVKHYQIKN
jgi:hypothetical protein